MKHRTGIGHVPVVVLVLALAGTMSTLAALRAPVIAGVLAAPKPPVTTESVAATCFGLAATIADHGGEISGTPGDDVIIGNNGDNIVHGEGGTDHICTGGGDDEVQTPNDNAGTLYAKLGPGDDTTCAGTAVDTSHNVIYGGDGYDIICGSEGPDDLFGGPGDKVGNLPFGDQLSGRGGDDNIHGGPGDDYITGNEGFDTLDGGKGHDRCLVGGGGTTTRCERVQ